MAGSTDRHRFSARSRIAGLRLACGFVLAGASAAVLAQGLSGASTPPPPGRRVTELSTVPREPVMVQGGHWGPGHFGGSVPGVSDGVTVFGPNVVLGWGGRPPFDYRPVPEPHNPWGAAPYPGGGYPGGGYPGGGYPGGGYPGGGYPGGGYPGGGYPGGGYPGGGYPGAGHPGGGPSVPHRGSPPGAWSPGAGAQPPAGSLHRWSSGSGAR